jgi:hypothetical protein
MRIEYGVYSWIGRFGEFHRKNTNSLLWMEKVLNYTEDVGIQWAEMLFIPPQLYP